MKHILLFVLIALGSASCNNCIEGVGAPIEERRTMESFSAVDAKGSFDVVLYQLGVNEQAYVIIQAPANLIPNIEASVRGGSLNLSTKSCYTSSETVTIQVYAPSFQSIKSQGTGKLSSGTPLIGEELSISNQGTGEINLPLNFIKINVDNSGTGSIRLKGETKDVKINNQGTGDILADELRANNATVSSQGTGNVHLQAHQSLDVKLQGTGDVIYTGEPQDIQQSNQGTGRIERR